MQNGLVSIISPCYNGEKYIKNFLDSVLSQTYSNIELIIVNDGSVDETENILKQYERRLEERGYSYIHYKQENKGQAAAINTGLKLYSGEYLMWVDSDDILMPQNVEKKVDFLQKNRDCGFVICQGIIVNSDDLDKEVGKLQRKKPKGKDDLFSDLIFERNVVFCPGVIMARRTAVEQAIPNGTIFESREGQNWQLMLPLAYSFKCGYIEEVHFRCVAHNDSHSRTKQSYERQMQRNDGFIELLTETISNIADMPQEEKQRWIAKVYIKHHVKKMQLAYRDKKKEDYISIKRMLKEYIKEHHMRRFYFNYLSRRMIDRVKGAIRRIVGSC